MQWKANIVNKNEGMSYISTLSTFIPQSAVASSSKFYQKSFILIDEYLLLCGWQPAWHPQYCLCHWESREDS